MRWSVTGLLLASGVAMSGITWATRAPSPLPVAAQGETHITAGVVRVDLMTRPATAAENMPGRATRCTGGWIACSLVDALSIRIEGRTVLVPKRLPLLLSDISTANIVGVAPNHYRLTLTGGDAAAAYEARIYFDLHMVRRVEFWSGEMHALEQATDYHDMASETPSD